MSNLLEVRDARREFLTPEGDRVAALDGVSLSVASNEFVTLLGPSGCGKTTLLRAISGFEQLDGGSLHLGGADIGRQPPFRRPVNTVFQSYALFSHMNVARNVGFALEVAGLSREQRAEQVAEALQKVGLAELGARRPSQLSGGQRQRVALARAIIARPKLLLLDEPLSALDRNLRQQMQIELKTLQHSLGIAFLFVTHDQEEALTMSDRVVVMRAGRIEQIGTPRDIYRRPRTRFVAEFIGETNLFDLTIDRVETGEAEGVTSTGTRLRLPAGSYTTGDKLTAVLRPSDLSLGAGAASIPVRLKHEVYRGSDLHLFAQTSDGHEVRATARDVADRPQAGEDIVLGYDPASVHVLENA